MLEEAVYFITARQPGGREAGRQRCTVSCLLFSIQASSVWDGASHQPTRWYHLHLQPIGWYTPSLLEVPLTPQPTGRFHSHSGHIFSHIPLISENTLPDCPRNILQESSRCVNPDKLTSQLFFLETSKDHTFSNLLGFLWHWFILGIL